MKNSRSIFVLGLLISIATLIGVALRIRFAAEPLWIDELHTAWAIDTRFGDIAFRAGQGNQTPIYFWISWLVCHVFGSSEFVLRLPSVVFSSTTIVLASLFVWRFTGDAVVSGIVALLVAIDSWFIFYGSEARPYALLQMLSIIQIGCLMRELNRDLGSSRGWIGRPVSWSLMLLTSTMIATHLTAINLVAAELLFVLVFANSMSRNRIVLSLILSCLVLVPLFPTLISAFEKRTDWEQISDNTKLLREAASSLLVYGLVPAICLLGCRSFKGKIFRKRVTGSQSGCGLQTSAFAMLQAASRSKYSPPSIFDACDSPISGPVIALTLFWGLGPLMIVWVLEFSGTIPLAAHRYATIGSVAFPIFAGLAIAAIRCAKLWLPICFLILLLAPGINPIADSFLYSQSSTGFRNEDWKSAIAQLGRTRPAGNQPIFLFANLVEDHRASEVPCDSPMSEYLKFPLTGIFKLPNKSEIIPMPTHASSRWNAGHLSLITRVKGAQVIARVTLPEMRTIVAELQAIAQENSVELECEIFIQPGNVIKTAFISCRTTASNVRTESRLLQFRISDQNSKYIPGRVNTFDHRK